ncbi:MAG: glycerol-3-phosphate dehydrogenase [Alphaproteobacteria bacterium]|nr:glycerol-3-phosphate dehydrogenase [Alphaproteobacteria bacterium]
MSTQAPETIKSYDIAIIGGGVNGCGVARDAAGRGLKVFLCEKDDLASGTSSRATKLIHGGLRYLEHYEFRLVSEALGERERLWSIAPHIVWPLRLVLPYRKGLRPPWLLRAGLFLYDSLGGRDRLPGTRTLDLSEDEAGKPLKVHEELAYEFSDCWVQDARLVVLNARDAAVHGADIRPRTQCIRARRENDMWRLELKDMQSGAISKIEAKSLVNAAGPWVDVVENQVIDHDLPGTVRLVQGSHIVVKKLFDHDRAYFFQNPDDRVLFAIPYEEDFTLIGTTDRDYTGDPGDVVATGQDISYLCDAVSEYFKKPVTPDQVVWSYSGVRPLFDDGASKAQEATRDFVLQLDANQGRAPIVSVYGGKMTTYRRLSEEVLEKLKPYVDGLEKKEGWTGRSPLPGGDYDVEKIGEITRHLATSYPFLPARQVRHFMRHYGKDSWTLLGKAKEMSDLGRDFGGGLTEAEVAYLRDWEWAVTASDIVWRRTKYGLRMTPAQIEALDAWLLSAH